MICPKCNKRKRKPRKYPSGKVVLRPLCGPCAQNPETLREQQRRANLKKKPYHAHRGEVCERCGFVAEHICQMDVDHIDGDHDNHDPANLMTLCANCHRLKTWEQQDYMKRGKRGRNVVVVLDTPNVTC